MYQSYGNNYYPQYSLNAQQRLQQMEQQYPQFAQQGVQPPPQNVSWIPVSGVQGAKDHIVQPGQTVWMMDNNAPVFYVKSADNMGTSTFRAYRFEEIQPDAPQQAQNHIDMSEYVKRDEFDKLKETLNSIEMAMQKYGE